MVAVVLSLVALGVSGYMFTVGSQSQGSSSQLDSLSTQLHQTNTQLAQATSQLTAMQTTLTGLNAQVATLTSRIGALEAGEGGTPSTGLTPQQIYNQTANSVVLIEVPVTGGYYQGSGFVVDSSGLIVTNNHVIANATVAGSIIVTVLNGTMVEATIVGADVYSDLAVIRVSAPAALLKPLRLGSSSSLQVGDTVYALGNPFQLTDTMTRGIISAVGRTLDEGGSYVIVDVLQTDAAVNPGNSGGPLLNGDGLVVGINTAGETNTSSGLNFAIPSDTIARELPSLESTGGYNHPYLGISAVDVNQGIVQAMNLPAGTFGVLVTSVVQGGPAAQAGLVAGTNTVLIGGVPVPIGGDVIVGADGKTLKNFYQLMVYVERNKKSGDHISLSIIRNGAPMTVDVVLGVRP